MKKQILNVIYSPLIYILFIVITIILTINYFTISNQEISTVQLHNIEYSEDSSKYDAEIERLNENLDELIESGKKQDDKPILRIKETIRIYEYLKTNNINFEKVFDSGGGETNERFIYTSFSFYTYIALILISSCVYAYVVFTSDFDNARYSIIYSNTRYKVVLCKITLFLFLQIFTFIFIYLFNYLVSLTFNKNLDYYLIINESETKIIGIGDYLFHFDFMYYLYITLLTSLIVISLSLIFNKSIFTLISMLLLSSIVFIISKFYEKIMLYIGVLSDLQSMEYTPSILARLFIFIPIFIAVLSVIYFEKKDLK